MSKNLFLFHILVSFLIAISACGIGEKKSSPLPNQILEMKLIKEDSGEEARQIINRLHGKNVALGENYIGHYGTSDFHSMLYVTVFQDEKEPEKLLSWMSNRIGDGSSGFWHHREMKIDEIPVHMVLDRKQVHYFFQNGKNLYWLAVPPSLALEALAEILNVDMKLMENLNREKPDSLSMPDK